MRLPLFQLSQPTKAGRGIRGAIPKIQVALRKFRNVAWPRRQKPIAKIVRIAVFAYIFNWLCARHSEIIGNNFLLGWERVCSLIPGLNLPEMLSRTSGWHFGENWTYPRLEEGFDPSYTIENEKLCFIQNPVERSDKTYQSAELFLLILSSAQNFRQRKTIRQTWGRRMAEVPNARMAFFVGTSKEDSVNVAVKKESRIYGDLIQSSMFDSKFNIARKEFSAMLWASDHCPDMVHYVKTDDDIYVVVDELMAFSYGHRDARNAIFGPTYATRCFNPVMMNFMLRGQSGMGGFEDWRKSYPFFVVPEWTVQTYLYTKDAPGKLIEAARSGPFWFSEGDLMINGVLAERAGVQRVHVSRFKVPWTETVFVRALLPRAARRYLYAGAVVVSHLVASGSHLSEADMHQIHDLVSSS